ncbi:hydantoinase [Bordetella trematum]|uniref:Hydantoin utilization protein B n=1 Tax=Bordetella trematum TaxID=123899 RepID=A0A157MJJ3_9BORD|nr:hydantoinase B/oxoprolinase family protein [Bordetella trematum]AZR95756.1 hydantoinase [Bordetella trematum]NNH18816.1 hydantoinase B/oxoprolinase family protein [Bordetella trematum]SAI08709.1 hydantoin utilization protein B [Bordetella trematum]SAI68025.1 hydantoin utilization protein B [Bordetella trematum]SUV95834.1 hydantoin utilization protein B [Bordetella trematum]
MSASASTPTVDPITLAVVRGALETAQREMTLTLEKTGRSSVFNLAHDYSNALFDHLPEMILQGQDIPIHLGSLIPAMKAVAEYFGDDIHEGDIIYHNDPVYQGSHILDCCMYKPVFHDGELVFWTVCKGHLTDIGGPVPAGYNPDARELYAEGLRIPPVKLWDRGQRREDVINLLLCNMRARRDQEGDLNAQYGACRVGERHLMSLLARYGLATVQAAIAELKNMADRHMRSLIASIPDGTYHGRACLEDAGHGYGDLTISAAIDIRGDSAHIRIDSPPQVPYFINSYAGNSLSGIYLGLMMFAQVPPPYNAGLYRCITVDLGPQGTLCNAREPAPHVNCTTTPMETLTDAVRQAFEVAAPERVTASWGHASGVNIAGVDPRTGEQYVTMVLASIISGAGATRQMDGWHACGPLCCFGALSSGDVELLEHAYPIIIHRYGLQQDSGGAGQQRGGSGTVWEVEPIGHDMTVIAFGEGRQIPTGGAAGAYNVLTERKLGRLEHHHADGTTTVHRKNTILNVGPGERARNINPGGGGYGDPCSRDPGQVALDVRNGLVSHEAAQAEYGVALDSHGQPDLAATRALRTRDPR